MLRCVWLFWTVWTTWTVTRQATLCGIFQAGIVEWTAKLFSRGSSWPRDRTCVSLCLLHWQADSLPLVPPENIWVYNPKELNSGTLNVYLYTCVYSSMIFNNQKVKAIQVSIVGWVDKQCNIYMYIYIYGLLGGSVVKNLPASAADVVFIPGLGRSPGEGNGNPLPFTCLGNPMDRGAGWATVHGIEKELDMT